MLTTGAALTRVSGVPRGQRTVGCLLAVFGCKLALRMCAEINSLSLVSMSGPARAFLSSSVEG